MPNDKTKEVQWAYLLLILPPLLWAGNTVLARGVADLIPPIAMSFWRWLIALTLLLPFIWEHVLRDWAGIKRGWKNILLLGLLGIASFNTLLYTAAQTWVSFWGGDDSGVKLEEVG